VPEKEKCPNCGRPISSKSPPPNKDYERGRIDLDEYSHVLLPSSVVAANFRKGTVDSHVASLSGRYCDLDCLIAYVRRLLHITKSRTAADGPKAKRKPGRVGTPR
jgi:hypothetical protein